jgi:hypothetical protein
MNFASQSESKQINVKEEEDPLLIIAPFMKAENEVSYDSFCCYTLKKKVQEYFERLLPEYISQIKHWSYFRCTDTFFDI